MTLFPRTLPSFPGSQQPQPFFYTCSLIVGESPDRSGWCLINGQEAYDHGFESLVNVLNLNVNSYEPFTTMSDSNDNPNSDPAAQAMQQANDAVQKAMQASQATMPQANQQVEAAMNAAQQAMQQGQSDQDGSAMSKSDHNSPDPDPAAQPMQQANQQVEAAMNAAQQAMQQGQPDQGGSAMNKSNHSNPDPDPASQAKQQANEQVQNAMQASEDALKQVSRETPE